MTRYFHATSFENAQRIRVEGFRAGRDGMFGPGIYFSETFMGAIRKARCQTVDTVIIVNLNVGRLMTEEFAHNDWNLQKVRSRGYDSVQMTHCKTGVEICVYEPSRIRILEINHLSNDDKLVGEVLIGRWGNGTNRRVNLQRSGHNYNSIQNRINQYYHIADEVIQGRHGNGKEREIKITKMGYNCFLAQHIVNVKLSN